MKLKRMTKKRAKQQADFRAEAVKLLEQAGAFRTDDGESFRLHTLAGDVTFSVYDDWIAGRFTDPDAGYVATLHDSNPYSGKWNYHPAMDDHSGADIANWFIVGVLRLLRWRPGPDSLAEIARLRDLRRQRWNKLGY